MIQRILFTFIVLFALSASLHAATPAENLAGKPDDWFRSDDGQKAWNNILSWQTEPALTRDDKASPLWARFYEIPSNRPIFSDRDGVVKYDIEQIGGERRGGYTWYGNWGDGVAKAYAKWRYR